MVTVILAEPFFLPVTFPLDDTVATFGLLDLNVTFTSTGLPVYFVTFVKPVGNVTLMVWLLPLFKESDDVALALDKAIFLSIEIKSVLVTPSA